MPALERTFEAVIFGWDGTAVRNGRADAAAVRRRVEALCAHAVDVAVVSGARLENIDGQLRARPSGPGRLFLALNRGSELYAVDTRGPRLVRRRRATPHELAALDEAAALVVRRLAERGIAAALGPVGLNRRTIVIDDLEGADSPKTRVAELLGTMTTRPEVRVTGDGRDVEIGLTDESDSMRALLRAFRDRGIGPGLLLVVGNEFGSLAGAPGKDSLLLVPEAARATAVSVGVEPTGVPAGVLHAPGGPRMFGRLLDEQLRRRANHRVPSVDEDPAWTLVFTGTDPVHARVRETLMTLGDGVIGVRGSHEESDPHEVPMVLASGVYHGDAAAEQLMTAPSALGLDVVPDGRADRRVLDLRTGVLVRGRAESSGPEHDLRTLRFVAAGQRGVVAMRAEGPAARFAAGPVLRQPAGRPMTTGQTGEVSWARTTGGHGGIAVAAAQTTVRIRGHLVVERVAAYAPDARRPPSIGRAVAVLTRARQSGFEALLAEHRAAWARRWSDACVGIPDDPDAQLGARFALFALWNNVARRGEAAVGARGLSGPGYAGHVFWDADVYVLPAIATMAPAAARAMLDYRVNRLPQARSIAALRNLEGARFPWESASAGVDVTPTSGRMNGEWTPILTGQLEEHINADVAWAACHYAAWTGDHAFLSGPGHALVTDTARYWASRAHVDPDGTAHIRHVIGPDEYHDRVDDNAYTNILARWHLRTAANLVGATPEAQTWLRLADALVDNYDAATGRHEQFAGYYRLEPVLATDLGTPPLAADLLLGPRIRDAQIIKQPDVLMAHHLLPAAMPAGSLAADLDFYLPRTAHGSSLSPAITAALLARAGRPDEALTHLDLALRLDLDDLTGMTGAGLHLATLAGVWQALLFGFAGARVAGGTVWVDPHLPGRWGSLALRMRALGRRVELQISPRSLVVTTSGPLTVQMPGANPVRVAGRAHFVHTDNGWKGPS